MITIPGQPQAKQRARLGNGFVYTPKKTKDYETLVAWSARQAGITLTEKPVRVEIRAYFQIPKSWPAFKREMASQGTLRPVSRPDSDNIGKIVCDALNEIAWEDDAQVVDLTISKYYSERPRVEVEIAETTSS